MSEETTTKPASKRRPRFRRAEAPVFELTERDGEIIKQVAIHRFLRSTQIGSLVGGSQQKLLRRLRLLFDAGFLERPREQMERFHSGTPQPFVYGLGDRGAELAGEMGLPIRAGDWSAKNQDATRRFLEHTLFVADVMIGLELACKQKGNIRFVAGREILAGAPEATQALPRPFRWAVPARFRGEQLKVGVEPDGVFGLHFVDEPEGRNRAYFFVEADRSTMPVTRERVGGSLRQNSILRKLVAYQQTFRDGLHTRLFGLKKFRVLVVTTSKQRVENMVEAAELVTGGGSGLFLFTDEAQFNQNGALELGWHAGRRGAVVRLTD